MRRRRVGAWTEKGWENEGIEREGCRREGWRESGESGESRRGGGGEGECVQDRQGARRPYPSVGVAPSSSAAASPARGVPALRRTQARPRFAIRRRASKRPAGRPAQTAEMRSAGWPRGLRNGPQAGRTGGSRGESLLRSAPLRPPTPSAALTAALIVAPSSPRSPFLTRPVGRLAVGGPHGSKRLRPAAVQASCHLGGQLFFMDTQARCRDTKATQTRLCATYR